MSSPIQMYISSFPSACPSPCCSTTSPSPPPSRSPRSKCRVNPYGKREYQFIETKFSKEGKPLQTHIYRQPKNDKKGNVQLNCIQHIVAPQQPPVMVSPLDTLLQQQHQQLQLPSIITPPLAQRPLHEEKKTLMSVASLLC